MRVLAPGDRPAYVWVGGGRIETAPSIRELLDRRPGCFGVDLGVLTELLVLGERLDHRTLVAGVWELLPGEMLEFADRDGKWVAGAVTQAPCSDARASDKQESGAGAALLWGDGDAEHRLLEEAEAAGWSFARRIAIRGSGSGSGGGGGSGGTDVSYVDVDAARWFDLLPEAALAQMDAVAAPSAAHFLAACDEAGGCRTLWTGAGAGPQPGLADLRVRLAAAERVRFIFQKRFLTAVEPFAYLHERLAVLATDPEGWARRRSRRRYQALSALAATRGLTVVAPWLQGRTGVGPTATSALPDAPPPTASFHDIDDAVRRLAWYVRPSPINGVLRLEHLAWNGLLRAVRRDPGLAGVHQRLALVTLTASYLVRDQSLVLGVG